MRLLVRLVALVLALLLAILLVGPMMPEGSFINDAGDAFARALHIQWFGPFG